MGEAQLPNLEKGTIRRLRQRLFVPSPMGLPWFGQLPGERRTILVNERGVRARIDDNWRNAGEVNVCYGSWTGFTIFPLRDVEVDWDRWKAYGWGDEGSYEEDEEQTDETGEEPENEDEAADGEDRGPTGESEERQPAQGPASIKRRIKLQRRLHRPGGPFDREKGGQRPFGQMASKKRFGLGIKIWP